MAQLLNKICIIILLQSLVLFGDESNGIRVSLGGENANFLAAIEDVPLMSGLIEDETKTLNFNKPSGRLVQAHTYGQLMENEIVRYYKLVLPEFGWQNIDNLVFSREGELLRINCFRENNTLIVIFMLSPESAK